MRNNVGIRLRKYIDEALGLGIFMLSAGFFDALVEYPGLPFHEFLQYALLRRFVVGLCMGVTALYIFTSGFGKQSGAYINPAVTIVRFRLKQINLYDGLLYIIFQMLGGGVGMVILVFFFPGWMKDPAVNYVVTVPGKAGITMAFIMEFAISLLLILVVLLMGRKKKIDKYTPVAVASLITLFITFESPYSGMSMNPARTFASAVVADQWKAFWLYCLAPVSGMWIGSSLYLWWVKRST